VVIVCPSRNETLLSTPALAPHRAAVSRIASHARLRSITTDGVVYALVLGGIYLLLGTLWFVSAKEKLIDGGGTAPAGIHKEFSGTFLSSFPGTDAAWVILGLIEVVAFVLLVGSLLRGEFLQRRAKPVLLCALGLSMATFAILAFGDTIAQQFDGTASLFSYFAATGVLLVITLLMPPYRSGAWLSSLVPQRDRVDA
jgi:hypothetical protein